MSLHHYRLCTKMDMLEKCERGETGSLHFIFMHPVGQLQDVCHQSRKQKLVYAVMAVPCFSDIPGTFPRVQLPHFKVFFKYENEQAQMDTLCL